jgi:hypothetical protein
MSMIKFSFRGRLCGLLLLVSVCIGSTFFLGGEAAQASSFTIAEDAFSISNGPGYCFAMSAFARWYYLTRQGEPSLRRALDHRTQQRIARQLQDFYSKNLVSAQAEFCNHYQGKERESFSMLAAGLASGEPRIVLLMNRADRGPILHAVLAYEWVPEKQVLKVYDPNYSNEERLIDLETGRYTSLDITYNAICFPEVLNNHQELVRKMETLYASLGQRKRNTAGGSWRGEQTAIARGPVLKPETYSRGQAR